MYVAKKTFPEGILVEGPFKRNIIYDTPLLLLSALLIDISFYASVTKSTLVDLGSSENIFSASPPKFSDIPPIECSKAFPSTT